MNNYVINNVDEFLIDIYVIGYKNKGESIYIRLKSINGKYVKDILIDCYATEYNRTLELLERVKKNNYIDYICVSHYHDDHIKEMDKIIKKYSRKDTTILTPNIDREESLSEIGKNVKRCIAERRARGRRNWGHIITLSEPRQDILSDKIESNGNKIDINISSISPYSDITAVNAIKAINEVEQNDYSIALVIKINELSILCTSDIMDNTIKMLEKQGLIHYLKIPHHGSNDSNRIFEKIELGENTICVSTNYVSSGIPKKEVLNLYDEKTHHVYVTYNDDDECDYGIVHTRYVINLNSNEIRYGTQCDYNSQKYEQEKTWYA